MDSIMAIINDADYFLNPDVSGVIFFLSTPGRKTAGLNRKNSCLKKGFVIVVERAINKDITLVKSRLNHNYLRLRIACRIFFKSEGFDFGCVKINTFAASF